MFARVSISWLSAKTARWLLLACLPAVVALVGSVVTEVPICNQTVVLSGEELLVAGNRAIRNAQTKDGFDFVVEVSVWNVSEGRLLRRYREIESRFQLSQDGRWLACISPTGKLRILSTEDFRTVSDWDLEPKARHSVEQVTEELVVTKTWGATDRPTRHLWNRKTHRKVDEFRFPADHVFVTTAAKGRSFVVLAGGGSAQQYFRPAELTEGQLALNQPLEAGEVVAVHRGKLCCKVKDHHGQTSHRILDLETGADRSIGASNLRVCDFAGGDDRLINIETFRNAQVTIYDSDNGTELHRVQHFSLLGNRGISDADVSDDLLATADVTGVTYLWEMNTGKLLRRFPDDRWRVWAAGISALVWCSAWILAGRRLIKPVPLLDIALFTALSLTACLVRARASHGVSYNANFTYVGRFLWQMLVFGQLAGVGSLTLAWLTLGRERWSFRLPTAIAVVTLTCLLIPCTTSPWSPRSALEEFAMPTAPLFVAVLALGFGALRSCGYRFRNGNPTLLPVTTASQWTLSDLLLLMAAVGLALTLALSRQGDWWRYYGSPDTLGGLFGTGVFLAGVVLFAAWSARATSRSWRLLARSFISLGAILVVLTLILLRGGIDASCHSFLVLQLALFGSAACHTFLAFSVLRWDGYALSRPPAPSVRSAAA